MRVRAFTLLELLLATVLLSMLMVGVLSVVTRLGSAANRTIAASNAASPQATGSVELRDERNRLADSVVRLLRDDLEHAIDVDRSEPGRLVFVSYRSLADSQDSSHRPVRIAYSIERVDGRAWLVRRQWSLDGIGSHDRRRDLVCADVKGFELVSLGDAEVRQEAPSAPKAAVGPASTATAAPGPDDSVLFNGVMYYRKYLPPGALKAPTDSAGAGRGRSNSSAAHVNPAPSRTHDAAPAETIWRIRLWLDDVENKSVDALVTLRRARSS